jgi:hypothetical protein
VKIYPRIFFLNAFFIPCTYELCQHFIILVKRKSPAGYMSWRWDLVAHKNHSTFCHGMRWGMAPSKLCSCTPRAGFGFVMQITGSTRIACSLCIPMTHLWCKNDLDPFLYYSVFCIHDLKSMNVHLNTSWTWKNQLPKDKTATLTCKYIF